MTAIDVTLWREYSSAATEVPGMFLGAGEADGRYPGDTARQWFDEGVRKVGLPGTVDIRRNADHAAALEQLSLVRELTGIGMAVQWVLHCDDNDPIALLRHLYPPADVIGADTDAAGRWRGSYRFGDLFYRKGPGFIHVRDARWKGIRRLTLDRPGHFEAVDLLSEGATLDRLPPRIANGLRTQRLVLELGSHLWWLPYRISRWPDTRG